MFGAEDSEWEKNVKVHIYTLCDMDMNKLFWTIFLWSERWVSGIKNLEWTYLLWQEYEQKHKQTILLWCRRQQVKIKIYVIAFSFLWQKYETKYAELSFFRAKYELRDSKSFDFTYPVWQEHEHEFAEPSSFRAEDSTWDWRYASTHTFCDRNVE